MRLRLLFNQRARSESDDVRRRERAIDARNAHGATCWDGSERSPDCQSMRECPQQ
ncbi:Uncharacterized protein DAT39_008146 [Clarias magur]|uniref:Uncharacterized protein n=1 Tax=Clarias magur TaxID=1594786 RepID=A0A8J4XCD6_CLAMG|nr:Uncharacterized protein DAT39_008146 [Clarias magur]